MIKKLYSVYDKKAENCLAIFEQPNDLVALRDFSRACTDKRENNVIAEYPDDYCLKSLGEFDSQSGEIKSDVKIIAEAKDYVNQN